MSQIVAVIQARMSSTRLPGKVLCDIAGMPMLELVVSRLRRCAKLDEIIIATSTESEDDLIEALRLLIGVSCHRGELADVRERFKGALDPLQPNHFVRITGDCPLIDPDVVDHAIYAHLSTGADYTSNTIHRTYPKGLDVEVIKYSSFLETFHFDSSRQDTEHVTPLMRSHDGFQRHNIEHWRDLSSHRWTVDYLFDLEKIRRLAIGVPDVIAGNMSDFLDAAIIR